MRVRVNVFGLVQGVFFRLNTKQKAEELGIKGWVRNKEDGSVEIVAEGDEDKIERLIEWCKLGPGMARVDRVEVEKDTTKEKFKGFEIRY